MRKLLTVIFILLCFPLAVFGIQAFPEAEGFGSDTVGGRNGSPDIYVVSNTNDSGTGSLREAVEASGDRIVVFSTGGTITGNITITNPYITIAGQTAPGGGITIKGSLSIHTHDVVVRYLTVRGASADCIHLGSISTHTYNVVIDHCSTSWSGDENISAWYKTTGVTISWCITSEGISGHSMGMMLGGYFGYSSDKEDPGRNFSVHHNYGAHNEDRNGPYLRNGGYADIVNNIFYHPAGNNSAYSAYEAEGSLGLQKNNLIKNYFKRQSVRCWRTYRQNNGTGCETYVEGNYHWSARTSDGQDEDACVYSTDQTINGPNTTGTPYSHLVSSRWTNPPSVTEYDAFDETSSGLVSQVLGSVGNSQKVTCLGQWESRRDTIDARVIQDFYDNDGGFVSDPEDVGGYPTIAAGTPCTDTDSDGMPDAWETATYGDLTKTATGDEDSDGYLNIEEYFNGDSNPPTISTVSSSNGKAQTNSSYGKVTIGQ